MRRVAAIGALGLLACGGPSGDRGGRDTPDPTPAPAPVTTSPTPVPTGDGPTVTVVDGDGGGTFAAGARVPIWARVDPQAEIVTGWDGDGAGGLADPLEWTSVFEVPDHDVTLTPTRLAVAAPLAERTLAGRRALVSEVEVARGVVVFFHGAAYSVDQIREAAPHSVLLHLHHAGYTVVVAESAAEAAAGTGGWSAGADLAYAGQLWDAIAAEGWLADGGSRVAWGMSSGGMFAHAVGRAHGMDAVVAFCAAGAASDLAETQAETGWYLAERDGTFPTAAADAATFSAELTARGVRNERYVHPSTPLYGARFLRAGLDLAASEALVDAIRGAGLLDDTSRFRATGAEAAAAVTALPTLASASPEVRKAVGAEVEILAADHELYDEAAARLVAFLDGV